jgi:hypothetical protein
MALSKLPRQKLNPNGLLLMVLLQALTGSRMVLNGASDLFFEVFGPDVGCHARSSMGVNGLAARQPVEVEGIFEIEKERLT